MLSVVCSNCQSGSNRTSRPSATPHRRRNRAMRRCTGHPARRGCAASALLTISTGRGRACTRVPSGPVIGQMPGWAELAYNAPWCVSSRAACTRRTVARAIVGRGDQVHLHRAQANRAQAAVWQHGDAQRQVEPFIDQIDPRIGQVHVDDDAGMQRHELADQRRDRAQAKAHRHRDPHRSGEQHAPRRALLRPLPRHPCGCGGHDRPAIARQPTATAAARCGGTAPCPAPPPAARPPWTPWPWTGSAPRLRR